MGSSCVKAGALGSAGAKAELMCTVETEQGNERQFRDFVYENTAAAGQYDSRIVFQYLRAYTTVEVVAGHDGDAVAVPESHLYLRETDQDFLKMSGIGDLRLAQPAPLFEANAVVDGDFKTIQLSDYRGKYVVLFFYPLDFTFVCPTEIIAFSDRAEEFKTIGCEVLACSTDSVYSHLAWINTPRKQGGLGPMKIPLIADKTAEISKKYGCLKEDEGIAFRGLYIIDDKGNLRQITINDLPVGRSVDETLRLVQAFQFTDKHGEVCPAGWKPGKETMKPDPTGSKDYFTKVN